MPSPAWKNSNSTTACKSLDTDAAFKDIKDGVECAKRLDAMLTMAESTLAAPSRKK